MPNKELGIADPVYDALRIRSGQSIAPDLGGGSTGTGGIENKIYVWHADGSTIDTFDADAAGLALAITAAATNDTIWLPSIAIALTAGITLPASVTVRGISNRATLSFSGFSGDAVTLSSGSVLQDCTIVFVGTGATARGIVAPGIGCDIVSCSSLASGATTNIGAELTGADIDTLVNTFNIYGSGSGGTTAIGLRINNFVHAKESYGNAGSAATRNSGVTFACTSAANAGWFVAGYGNAGGTTSAGMEVEVNKFANIIDGFARGVTCGLLVGAGATAIVFALQWSSLCNSGTLTILPGSGTGSGVGSGNTPDWFNVQAYGATGDGVTDDTAAIQDTIDAAAAAGGGTVFFPEGIYIVGGALQDGAGANAQITLPQVHYTNDKWIGITLLGTAIPPASPDQASGQVPTGGSLIKGTVSAGAGGALLGAYGPAGSFANFTGVVLEIKDLSFQLPANPVISALNLSYVSRVNVSNVVLSTGTFYIDGITEPTTTTSYAIKSPNHSNYGGAEFDNVYAFGFYNAFGLTEHFIGSRVSAVGCKNGFVFSSPGHMIYLDKVLVVWCTVGIKITSKSYFNVEQYANERHDPTLGAKWYDRTYDIDDGSDFGYGSIRWHSTLSGGTGAEPPSFVVNGGANIVDVQAILGWGAGGDTTYLRLDTSNKPLTGPLTWLNSISGAGINLDNVHDGSTINASDDGAMFASFDAQVTVNGATDYNHIASLQDRTIYNGSGSLTNQWGYLSWPENSGSGTIVGRYGVMIFDVGGAGPVTNNYGVYVSSLSRGANNYALWVETNLSHFGGIVEVKPTGTAGVRLDPNSATGNFIHSISPANLTGNHRATLQNADGTLAYLTDVPSTLNDLSDVDTTGEATGDVIYDNGGTWQVYPLGLGSRITVSGTKIRFGNVGGGNYLEIDSVTGTLRLVGDATTWDDFRVEASVVKPGATAPQYKAFGPSGNLQALMFEASHHDEAMFEVQMPHNWLLGSNIYPHVHWTPTTADAGNVVWELEYSWANVGDAFGAPGNMATDPTAAGGTAWVHKLTDFKSGGNNYIDGTGKTLSSMLVCRLHRNSNSGSDTLNKDVALLEVDFHYQIDSLGSDERLVKDASASLLLESGDILLLESGDRLLLEQ